MVCGLSITTSNLAYAFDGNVEHWFGSANTIPYASAASDALDHGIALSILSSSEDDLESLLDFSFQDNGLKMPDANQEQLILWMYLNLDRNVAIRGALLLPTEKFTRLTVTLQRYHTASMYLAMSFGAGSPLSVLDVTTGNSRKNFINSLPRAMPVVTEFSVVQQVTAGT
jgi:hypothetical protein